MLFLAALASLLFAGASAQDFDDTQSWPARFDDDEPTPEETLVLSLVNGFRADPPAFAKRIRANPESLGVEFPFPIDWDMFEGECAELEPRPPLVHDLRLAKPARSHSLYTIANNHWGHEEREDGEFYTGQWPKDRLKAAGVPFSAGENTGTGRPDPWSIVAGLVLDAGPGGTGGMLEGRFLGGVAFVDHDGDGKYDVGEELDGVTIRTEKDALGTTWSSGGYGIPLERTPMKKLVLSYRGLEIESSVPSGTANIGIEADFSKRLGQACDELFERVEKLAAKEKSVPDKLLFDLMYLVRETPLPQDLQGRLAECTRTIGPAWEERIQLLDGLEERALEAIDAADARACKEVLKELRRAMRKAPQIEWFEFALEICEAKAKLLKIKRDEDRLQETEARREELLKRAADPRLRVRVRAMGASSTTE